MVLPPVCAIFVRYSRRSARTLNGASGTFDYDDERRHDQNTGGPGSQPENIDLEIPRRKLVVITGLSGSGKSSLAFDTIYAEGQRRYMETLSTYARQFVGTMERPDVDKITGLSPVVAIEQKTTNKIPVPRWVP